MMIASNEESRERKGHIKTRQGLNLSSRVGRERERGVE